MKEYLLKSLIIVFVKIGSTLFDHSILWYVRQLGVVSQQMSWFVLQIIERRSGEKRRNTTSSFNDLVPLKKICLNVFFWDI